MVEEEDIVVEDDYINLAPVCYHCAYYFGPHTYGFCRRFEIWVKTTRSCVGFEANQNEW